MHDHTVSTHLASFFFPDTKASSSQHFTLKIKAKETTCQQYIETSLHPKQESMASIPHIPDLDKSSSNQSLGSNPCEGHNPIHPQEIASGSIFLSAVGLGYEDAAPTVADRDDPGSYTSGSSKTLIYDGTRAPRRSSLKSEYGSHRRASMGSTSTTLVEVRVRGERFPIHRRRSIDFNASVLVKEVSPVTENALHEDIWLQPDDFAKIKSERRAVVEKHKLGTAEEHDDIRGLEKYLDRTGRIIKNRAWDAVLDEQQEQEMTGVFNGDRIAALYQSSTSGTPDLAAKKAKEDHEAIRDYLLSPRTTKLMMRRLSC